jgi:hypothetical protein
LPILGHKLPSVELFGVKMVALFNQAEAEDILLGKLTFENTILNKTIIDSLAEIGSEKSVNYIHKNYAVSHSAIKVKMIGTLLQISGESDAAFFAEQLNPEEYDIKMAAAKALVKLGEKGYEYLLIENNTESEELEKIISHAKQWSNH